MTVAPARTARSGVELEVPIRIESEMNRRDHHYARARRVKEQREAVHYLLVNVRPTLRLIAGADAILVTLTRLAPRSLDSHDNLRAGFKATVDQICTELGIDDGDGRMRFQYAQEHSRTYGARVRIEVVEVPT